MIMEYLLKLQGTWKNLPKFTETFLQSKDEMMNDVLLEYLDGYLTWDELCEEAQFIEAMFEEE